MISRDVEAEILRLHHAEKWPVGTIASQLHLHHSIVTRVLSQAGLQPKAIKRRPSILDPYVPFMLEVLTKFPRLRATRLYQMVRERGYRGSVDRLRHVVAGMRPRPAAEAFLRLRTLPGEQGQVDWGHFGKVVIGNAARPLMGFVMVLSYSRQIFLRFYLGAAIGGIGVEKYQIEEVATCLGVPVYAVIVKQSVVDAITVMRKEIADSFDRVTETVNAVIEDKTEEGQSVLVIGVGNTMGVAQ